jgi:hypothetical protein
MELDIVEAPLRTSKVKVNSSVGIYVPPVVLFLTLIKALGIL